MAVRRGRGRERRWERERGIWHVADKHGYLNNNGTIDIDGHC